jgi:hypothetical protein
VFDKKNNCVVEIQGEWIHKQLGKAKKTIKEHISRKNKKRTTNEKLVWEDFEVLECELVVKQRHKL